MPKLVVNDTTKSVLLATVSTLVTLIIFVTVFELVASYRYDQWKEEFQQSDEWYGMLTIESDNTTLLWEYRPNFSGEYLGATIATNRQGFRDTEHPVEKPPGVRRVVFAGDSVTVGVGVELQNIFVRQFQDIAHSDKAAPRVEAMSVSIDGYSGEQVLELIRERAIAFSPDVVVYVMCMNDFDFVRASGMKKKFFAKPESFFLRVIRRIYIKFLGGDYYEQTFKENGATVLTDVAHTNQLLTESGVEFYVALMPILKINDPYDEYPLTWLHAEIYSQLQGQQVPVIDLRPGLEEHAQLISLGFDELHLNERGHEETARLLVEAIL
jgi:lysophospholipase L1-like esterase